MANSFSVAGSLGKDAELRMFPNGDPVLEFAVPEQKGKGKDGNYLPSTWWNCQLFGKRAESLSNYLKKGTPVTVFGELEERSWQDNQGITQKRMTVRVTNITMHRMGGGGGGGGNRAPKEEDPWS